MIFRLTRGGTTGSYVTWHVSHLAFCTSYHGGLLDIPEKMPDSKLTLAFSVKAVYKPGILLPSKNERGPLEENTTYVHSIMQTL